MKPSLNFPIRVFLALTILNISLLSSAKDTKPISEPHGLDLFLNHVAHWRKRQMESQENTSAGIHKVIAWILCFLAASISSAGGVGGGSLYLPILNLVAGLDLKTAATFSAFMVTGGSVSNVLYNICFQIPQSAGKSLIDYDIALLSEPCMLLGVSIGVVCNVLFPEWLITVLFAVFLALSTFKTCKAGLQCWKAESDDARRNGPCEVQDRVVGNERSASGEVEKGLEDPLLVDGRNKGGRAIPWDKLLVLLMVWLSFFVLHVVMGDKDGKGIIHVRPCGVGYWLLQLSQLPLAIGFTAYILFKMRRSDQQRADQHEDVKDIVAETREKALPVVIFPLAALLSGILGGLFGIGGGLLINPVLLQIGIPPQITAATTTLMVFFSASMSLVQYLILGTKGIEQALVFALLSVVASVVGLVLVQKAIEKWGRASLIVFSVSTVMALSTVSITCFGAIDVWKDYTSGKNIGFKLPC